MFYLLKVLRLLNVNLFYQKKVFLKTSILWKKKKFIKIQSKVLNSIVDKKKKKLKKKSEIKKKLSVGFIFDKTGNKNYKKLKS